VCRSKHVEPSINFGIINSFTKLHLVGISTDSSKMHGSMNIRQFSSHKLAGPHGFQNIVLKHFPSAALKFIATIYNTCFTMNCFQTKPNVAKCIMIKTKR
jgi:hypothetical protein